MKLLGILVPPSQILNLVIIYLMPEIINQNFQYWTRVMHDIQKANAVGDSVDFPIIKVSEL